MLGRITFPFFGLYGASKFALEAITESYRYELSQLGVEFVLVQPSNYPTNIFASAQTPADVDRIPGYGPVGGIPGKMVQTLTELFEGDNPPNPHDVAQAIVRIIDGPKGKRPARVIVGQAFGADAINDTAGKVQADLLEGLGLGQLV